MITVWSGTRLMLNELCHQRRFESKHSVCLEVGIPLDEDMGCYINVVWVGQYYVNMCRSPSMPSHLREQRTDWAVSWNHVRYWFH